jgi:dihydrofolate synthase / folylpolyglutamate synthase
MTYDEAVARVSSLQNRGWRLGLDRMTELLRRAGLEGRLGLSAPAFVHVTGTNGKGSVTAFVQSLLMAQGWRTGATYSPYVFDLRERVQFWGPSDGPTPRPSSASTLIGHEAFASCVERLWPVAEELDATDFGGPTEFEFKTAVGFRHWADMDADWVALEVGLGGRLDATNVVDPACSAIVSIGLDHTEILGDTLAAIAAEKAGIIKPGRPVVAGDLPPEALAVVEQIALEREAPLWRYGHEIVLTSGFDGYRVETPAGSFGRLAPGLRGAWQPHNMAVAVAAVQAAGAVRDPKKVWPGVAQAWLPGRMQEATFRGRRFMLDGAHNADAARSLVASLRPAKTVLLTGMLGGHSATDFYEPLATVADEAHFVPIDFHRAKRPDDLDREAGWLFRRSVSHDDLLVGLEAVLGTDAELILVTGSFYLVGEVGRLIGAG